MCFLSLKGCLRKYANPVSTAGVAGMNPMAETLPETVGWRRVGGALWEQEWLHEHKEEDKMRVVH